MSFTVIREIGRGSFGVVEEVQDTRGQRFARKSLYINPTLGLSADDLTKRFKKEVRYQSQFNHKNIVQVLGSDLDCDPPFFIMPLAISTLKDCLMLDRGLGGDVRGPLFDILAGLEVMHALGICHRDLKPANVLQFHNREGGYFYALSDFGLVRGANGQSTSLTSTNAIGGTEAYAAPECAVNFKSASVKSDIYSFGAILHDIFGGTPRVPYQKQTVANPLIKPIVERCTERAQARRYGSIAELREALYQALSSPISFESTGEQEFCELLSSTQELGEDEWERICIFLEQASSGGNIYRYLNIPRIQQLKNTSDELFVAIARMFCDFVIEGSGRFDFEYCDVLADKLQTFYDLSDINVRSAVLSALMDLGTSHNRWYVERKFWNLVIDPNQDVNLIQRLLLDMQAMDISFVDHISHMERSIGVERSELPEQMRIFLERRDT